MAPGPVRLLDPQRLHSVHAGRDQAVSLPGLGDGVEDACGRLGGGIELPAQLADVGNPRSADLAVADLDFPGCTERESAVGQIPVRQSLQQVAGLGPHDPEDGQGFGNVGELGVQAFRDMAGQPVEVADLGRRSGDDQVAVLGLAGDGEVGLDSAPFVQPLGIDDTAGLDGDVIGRDLVEHFLGAGALEPELGERGLVEQADILSYRPVFGGGMIEPVLTAEAVDVFRFHAFGRVPVGALPPLGLAEARATSGQAIVKRRFADAPGGPVLVKRPVHGIEPPQGLSDALTEVFRVGLER